MEIEQGAQVRVGHEDHVAAATTVAAGRAPLGDLGLTTPRDRAVAPAARPYDDANLIDEAHLGSPLAGRGGRLRYCAASASTATSTAT